MRMLLRLLGGTALLVLSSWGMAFGQDTNFATGPQYLMTYGSPTFARPISTPSLSLSGPPLSVGATDAAPGLEAGADTQTVTVPSPDSPPVVDFFPIYYGVIPIRVVELSFAGESSSRELPASILDAGVWQVTTVQDLRERGYGVTLGEAAKLRKGRTRPAAHLYTNADIDRLHGGS